MEGGIVFFLLLEFVCTCGSRNKPGINLYFRGRRECFRKEEGRSGGGGIDVLWHGRFWIWVRYTLP